jgi:hypothetical protein
LQVHTRSIPTLSTKIFEKVSTETPLLLLRPQGWVTVSTNGGPLPNKHHSAALFEVLVEDKVLSFIVILYGKDVLEDMIKVKEP